MPEHRELLKNKSPFDTNSNRYEAWFGHHRPAYHTELLAVRALLPWQGRGIEIGVGSGQFAAPLGVRLGIDPSEPMLRHAFKKGIPCVGGVAEALPFKAGRFDYILIVTTLCFVDNPVAMLSECCRVLSPRGAIVIGFVNRNSALGKQYQARQSENIFYRHAVFYSCEELEGLLCDAGFADLRWVNTLSQDPKTMKDIEPLREGREEGAFVVVRAVKAG